MIGARIRQALKARDVSIRRLHEDLQGDGFPQTSYPAVHRYLSDQTPPPVEFVVAVARLLRVRLEWLLTGEGEALNEEWEAQDARARVERGRALLESAEDPAGYRRFIGTLPLGAEPAATHRRKALWRFERKVYDALVERRGFTKTAHEEALLAAAGRFLVAVDDAFQTAATPDEAARGDGGDRQAYGEGFLGEVLVRGDYPWESAIAWYDAVLDLFGRRVVWLGARDRRHIRPRDVEEFDDDELGAPM